MFFILNLLNNAKYIIIAAVVALLLVMYGCVKCSHHTQDLARVKHNNQKRDEHVEKDLDRTQLYEQRQKTRFLERKKVKNPKYKRLTPEELQKARDKNFEDLEGRL